MSSYLRPSLLEVTAEGTTSAALKTLAETQTCFPQSRYVTGPGLEWRVRDTGGAGEPLLLVPGALGTADIFFAQLVALTQRFRCMSVDYPAASMEALADGLADLMDQMRLPTATLLGTSLGGHCLQYFGARHGPRAKRVLLTNTFVDAVDLAKEPPFQAEGLGHRSGAEVKESWLADLEKRPPDVLQLLQLKLLRDGQDGELLKARLLAVGRASPSPMMEIEQDRVAILDCTDDPLLPERSRDALAARYPLARRVTLPTGGHYPYVTQAERFNRFVQDPS